MDDSLRDSIRLVLASESPGVALLPSPNRGLRPDETEVFLIDLYLYYLATVVRGVTGSSMRDGVRAYQKTEGKALEVEGHPEVDSMVRKCRDLTGNVERLAWWIDLCQPSLVITLGADVAAVARGDFEPGASARARDLFYKEAGVTKAFGKGTLRIVHCAHPGIQMREGAKERNDQHEKWCNGAGLKKIAAARRPRNASAG